MDELKRLSVLDTLQFIEANIAFAGMSLSAIKEIIRDINASIPKANNEYVRTGYEISLDIIRSALERNGLDMDNFTKGDVKND